MSKSRSQRAAGTRAKRSAESEVGECPDVVDVTVDVERLRKASAHPRKQEVSVSARLDRDPTVGAFPRKEFD